MTLLTNSAEGGTNGTTLTGGSGGNTGGASGDYFDSVTTVASGTLAFDNAESDPHGSLSIKVATGATAGQSMVAWSTQMGSQTTVWFRIYLYYSALPTVQSRIFSAIQTASLCSGLYLQASTGKLWSGNSSGGQIFILTNAIPTGKWFRIEGFVTGSATVGQTELKLFANADDTSPLETKTSAATQATTGPPNLYQFGATNSIASVPAHWLDDLGLSNTGYIGPAGASTAVQQMLTMMGVGS
jgi:hypothetical protein